MNDTRTITRTVTSTSDDAASAAHIALVQVFGFNYDLDAITIRLLGSYRHAVARYGFVFKFEITAPKDLIGNRRSTR